MLTFISDVDETTDGRFGIEWEDQTGARWTTVYDTYEERQAAIDANHKFLDEHKDEVDAHFLDIEIHSVHRDLKTLETDPAYLSDYEQAKAIWYKNLLLAGHKFTLKDFTAFGQFVHLNYTSPNWSWDLAKNFKLTNTEGAK